MPKSLSDELAKRNAASLAEDLAVYLDHHEELLSPYVYDKLIRARHELKILSRFGENHVI